MGDLKRHGAGMVAITPQLPEHSRTMIEKSRIGFDLLHDHGNEYAAKLGLRFVLPSDLQEVYRSFGNDLVARNGEASWSLAMPARIVVDRTGIVRAIDADPDYTRRPEPEKTVADVAALG